MDILTTQSLIIRQLLTFEVLVQRPKLLRISIRSAHIRLWLLLNLKLLFPKLLYIFLTLLMLIAHSDYSLHLYFSCRFEPHLNIIPQVICRLQIWLKIEILFLSFTVKKFFFSFFPVNFRLDVSLLHSA